MSQKIEIIFDGDHGSRHYGWYWRTVDADGQHEERQIDEDWWEDALVPEAIVRSWAVGFLLRARRHDGPGDRRATAKDRGEAAMKRIFIVRNRLTGEIWRETAFTDEARADRWALSLNEKADPFTAQYVVQFLKLVEGE